MEKPKITFSIHRHQPEGEIESPTQHAQWVAQTRRTANMVDTFYERWAQEDGRPYTNQRLDLRDEIRNVPSLLILAHGSHRRIVGGLHAHIREGIMILDFAYVDPNYRRQGILNEFTRVAIEEARQSGASEIQAAPAHPASRRALQRQDFREDPDDELGIYSKRI